MGENIWIDNPYDDRLSQVLENQSGKEWEFILISKWDKSDTIGRGMPEYDRYKEPVYNVLIIECDGTIAFRMGMGHVKMSTIILHPNPKLRFPFFPPPLFSSSPSAKKPQDD